MSEQAAAAAASNPAEGQNGSNEPQAKAQEASTEVATGNATAEVKSEQQEVKTERDADADNKVKDKREHHKRDNRDNKNNKRHDNKRGYDRYPPRIPVDKSEYDQLPQSSNPDEIRGQVEFYFSNNNLCKDEHMWSECQGPKNLPVSIKHICQFKRMQRFTPYSAVVDALRGSDFLEVVDNEERFTAGYEGVRRKNPIEVPARDSDERRKPTMEELRRRCYGAWKSREEFSIYVKGFIEGEPAPEKDVGQLVLEKFFKPYGPIEVRKRRDKDTNVFKGSVFLEFNSADEANQFLNLEPKPTYEGRELLIMTKNGYTDMKCKELGIVPDYKKPKEQRENRGHGNKDHKNGRGNQGNRDRHNGRGGRGGRGNNNRDRRDNRSSRDNNNNNNNNNNNKDNRDSRREPVTTAKDAYGVPIVKDSRETEKSNKRKAEDAGDDSPKRAKLEIKEDE